MLIKLEIRIWRFRSPFPNEYNFACLKHICNCLLPRLCHVIFVTWLMLLCMFDEIISPCDFQNNAVRLFHNSVFVAALPAIQVRRRPRSVLTIIQSRSWILCNEWKYQLHSLIDIECGYMQLFIAMLMLCATCSLIHAFVHDWWDHQTLCFPKQHSDIVPWFFRWRNTA